MRTSKNQPFQAIAPLMLACLLPGLSSCAGGGAPPAETTQSTELSRFIDEGLRATGLPGAVTLIMDRDGTILFRQTYGAWSGDRAIPIASASKWWAAATLMTLVDDGLIALDDPVADYLQEFRDKGAKSRITIRHTLSFTSGYSHHFQVQDDPSISQAEEVRFLAEQPALEFEPGTAFHYGGAQMEIAGRIAEVVTGQSYIELFRERIVTPLGLQCTDLANLRNRSPYDLVFDTANPLVPGGIVTCEKDYLVFLEMLMNAGSYRGTTVLSAAAVAEMFRDQTAGLRINRSNQEDDSYHYALGAWYRLHPGTGEEIITSGGALGTTPWINTSRQYAGLLMTQGRPGQAKEFVWRFMDIVTDNMAGIAVTADDYLPGKQSGQQNDSRPGSANRAGGRAGSAGGAQNPGDLFSRMDANGDGALERSEIHPRMERLLDSFDQLDRNGDGKLTGSELPATLRPGP